MAAGLMLGGLALLVAGAEIMIRGSSRLARSWGVSPLVVGLVVVAYLTSAPELAASLKGVFSGQYDVALGNVVGSNIFNVLFILGISALIVPLEVHQKLIRLDVPLMIGVSFLAILLGLDGRIGRLDGALLLAGLAGYTYYVLRSSREEQSPAIQQEYAQEYGASGGKGRVAQWTQAGLILGGLAALVLGARWFVDGAVQVARAAGLSELVIGLTVIAAGTSLPEVATSVIASLRKERDIAVGNVVGSNIFNVVGVLGACALLSPRGIQVSPAALNFDMPVMLAASVACLPVFFTGRRIERWEGALFLGYYAAYIAYLVLYSLEHDHLEPFAHMMLLFVVPITALTVFLSARRQYERNLIKRPG